FPPSRPALSSDSPYVVEWVRQGLDVPVLINYVHHHPRVHPEYEGRVSLVRVTSLRLGPLRLEDQGLYECRVLSLDRATNELQNGTWTLLSVTAPPTLTKAPPPIVEVLVGSSLSLTCVANGNPAPVITWLKDSKVLQTVNFTHAWCNVNSHVDSHMSFETPSGGQYSCEASSSQGTSSHSTRVNVKGPPVIIIPPKSTWLNMSQNALLQCKAVSDPPNMTYVWHKGKENVYHIDSLKSRVKIMVDGTLLISRLLPEDSGTYTCMPTNGLLTPPTASANLTVMHPAKALRAPQYTYLPTGKDGLVTCPTIAQPPLLRVEWTKDGEPLDLSMFPGWRLTADGSLVMATVNDDVAGIYTCTPYNSYGTMGPSGPITVKLQDPPSFSLVPAAQYTEEVGRSLLVPCQPNKDPTVNVTWSKVDVSRHVAYSITANGSLLLQPLTKEHQGSWECIAANRVASVTTSTQVYVLGTSPHAATALSVSPGHKEANVSWEAGFDGGAQQTFSVWVKRLTAGGSDEKLEWFSVDVPLSSGTSLQVEGLTPGTVYQFSVLSKNKMGTGPFSEIVTAQTLDALPRKITLLPPSALTASRDTEGILLRWTPPLDQYPPISAYLLQSRAEEEEEWGTVDEDVSPNRSEMVVPGLHRDRVYQLRLLSRRGEMLSEPSPSVNVSTVGMDMYPSTSRLLEFGPEPLLAGVLGGVAFMCLALILLLGVACLISHKRERRRRERRDGTHKKTSGSGSPDSMLKKTLLPSSNLYPTTSSTSSCSTNGSTYSSRNKRQSFSSHNQTSSSPLTNGIEMISRGPDGRFITSEYDTLSIVSKKDFDLHERRSISLQSDCDDKKESAYVLSVDLPPCKPEQSTPYNHIYPLVQVQKPSYEGLPDFSSLCSNSSLATLPHPSPSFPVLPHIRSGFGQPTTTASTLVLQMEHEREKGNLSRCLKLAQEREELERELRRYTQTDDYEEDSMLKYRSNTLPHKASLHHHPGSFSSASLHWEAYRLASLPPTPTPHLTRFGSVSPSCFQKERLARTPPSHEGAERFCQDGRLTLPRTPSKRQEKRDATPEGFDKSTNSTSKMRAGDLCCEERRQNGFTMPFQGEKYPQRCHSVIGVLPTCSKVLNGDVEMSVDEPDMNRLVDSTLKPMLHQRIASHVQNGCALSHKEQFHTIRRSKSLNSRSPVLKGEDVKRPTSPPARSPTKTQESKRRSQSLDSRRRKANNFLTPDAWINSLSQENCANLTPLRPTSLVWDTQSSPRRAKSPANTHKIQINSSQQRLTPEHLSNRNYEPRRDTTTQDYNYHEAMRAAGRYLEAIKKPFLEDDGRYVEYEEEEEGYRGIPESGSYSSYASSGRGSMDPPNNRLSLCHMSPTPQESLARMEDKISAHMEHSHR
uniref:Immunoglobulin superfamily, member 9a n=1 Tax=Periophthalmus magnuspinnatus TaxID=409849 RepID=A0A3B4BK78_9GOBI